MLNDSFKAWMLAELLCELKKYRSFIAQCLPGMVHRWISFAVLVLRIHPVELFKSALVSSHLIQMIYAYFILLLFYLLLLC